jgi:hypothetical protein
MDCATTGDVDLLIAGKRHVLRYDWGALAQLKTALGKDYDKAISQAMMDMDTEVLAKALACGLSPALRPEEIAAASPPLVTVIQAVDLALKYAHFGKEDLGDLVAANPPQRPTMSLTTLWKRLIGSRFGRA